MTSLCDLDTRVDAPSYASILVCGAKPVESYIDEIEKRIWPNITFWCLKCKKPCLIVRAKHEFASLSAHHAHQIVTWTRMKEYKLYD